MLLQSKYLPDQIINNYKVTFFQSATGYVRAQCTEHRFIMTLHINEKLKENLDMWFQADWNEYVFRMQRELNSLYEQAKKITEKLLNEEAITKILC